jgi:DNA-binding NarL/FixJ family response regulator
MSDSGESASQVLAAGASGMVSKSDAALDLIAAVEAIDKGKPFLSPAITTVIISQMAQTRSAAPSPGDLSARELEVLKLLAIGRSNKQVASALNLSVKTVGVHRANIMRKLKLPTFSDLIQFAIRHEIIKI